MSPAADQAEVTDRAQGRGGVRGVIDWLGAHLGVVPAFAVGCLVGVIIALPIVGSVLDGSVATLLGTFLGAAVTVAGAGMVATSASRREAAIIRREVLDKIGPLLKCQIPDASLAEIPRLAISDADNRALFDLGASADFAIDGLGELRPVLERRADIFVCTSMIQRHAKTVSTYARQAAGRLVAVRDADPWVDEAESREGLRSDIKCVAHAMKLLRHRVKALP